MNIFDAVFFIPFKLIVSFWSFWSALSPKAAFEQGMTLLKESHKKSTEVLLLKHQQDYELLQEDKERLLNEEVAACLTGVCCYLCKYGHFLI